MVGSARVLARASGSPVTDMHPRNMTIAELAALPVVVGLESHELSFVAPDGRIWDVGASKGEWSKRLSPTSPPPPDTAP